jgi:hypothetical protein
VRQAGVDVYLEQMSTIVDGDGTHVSMVCHIFSVVDGVISGVRGTATSVGFPLAEATHPFLCRGEGGYARSTSCGEPEPERDGADEGTERASDWLAVPAGA